MMLITIIVVSNQYYIIFTYINWHCKQASLLTSYNQTVYDLAFSSLLPSCLSSHQTTVPYHLDFLQKLTVLFKFIFLDLIFNDFNLHPSQYQEILSFKNSSPLFYHCIFRYKWSQSFFSLLPLHDRHLLATSITLIDVTAGAVWQLDFYPVLARQYISSCRFKKTHLLMYVTIETHDFIFINCLIQLIVYPTFYLIGGFLESYVDKDAAVWSSDLLSQEHLPLWLHPMVTIAIAYLPHDYSMRTSYEGL